MLKNNGKAGERRKRGRERAESSNPKRTKGSFRCMVSIDRSPHPHSFIRRAGCHARLEFPGRCQPPLHPIGRAKRVCLLLGSKFGCGTTWFTLAVIEIWLLMTVIQIWLSTSNQKIQFWLHLIKKVVFLWLNTFALYYIFGKFGVTLAEMQIWLRMTVIQIRSTCVFSQNTILASFVWESFFSFN